MIYRKTQAADDDLIAIYLWGAARFDVAEDETYLAGLAACFELIAGFPALAVERSTVDPPVRSHRYAAHLVIYRIERDHVLIIRVLQGRQDWETLLPDD